jgi:uncharacterized protein (DUF1778 family)
MSMSKKNPETNSLKLQFSSDETLAIKRAAAIGGYRSLTDFVIRSAVKQAEEIIQAQESILSSKRDAELFFDTVFNAPAPNEKLKAAATTFIAQF